MRAVNDWNILSMSSGWLICRNTGIISGMCLLFDLHTHFVTFRISQKINQTSANTHAFQRRWNERKKCPNLWNQLAFIQDCSAFDDGTLERAVAATFLPLETAGRITLGHLWRYHAVSHLKLFHLVKLEDYADAHWKKVDSMYLSSHTRSWWTQGVNIFIRVYPENCADGFLCFIYIYMKIMQLHIEVVHTDLWLGKIRHRHGLQPISLKMP